MSELQTGDKVKTGKDISFSLLTLNSMINMTFLQIEVLTVKLLEYIRYNMLTFYVRLYRFVLFKFLHSFITWHSHF